MVGISIGLPSCSGTTRDGKTDSDRDASKGPLDASSESGSGTESGVPLVTIPLTGCVSIGYSAPATIGGQTVELSLDTGSTDLGVALKTCTDCGVSPTYAAPNGTCSGSTTSDFGGGSETSSWSAEICTAEVQVGAQVPAVTMNIAGITTQSDFFVNYGCAGAVNSGILGLGPIDLDTIGTANNDAYFPELVQQGIPDVLALLLCSKKGALWFGGYDATYASGPPQFTPMTASGAWSVNLLSIGLGTQNLGGADSDSTIDTGTWGFYMPSGAYQALVAAMATDPGGASVFGAGTLDATFFSNNYFTGTGCAAPLGGQTKAQIDAALPPLTLTLPGVSGGSFTLQLPATESYLAPVPLNGSIQY
jgi:hypothetical protein